MRLRELIERLTWVDPPGADHRLLIHNSLFKRGPDSPPDQVIRYPTRWDLRRALYEKQEELERQGWRTTEHPDHETIILTKGHDYLVALRIDSTPPPDNHKLKYWHP